MRLDLFAKLKYQSNTKILSVGIKYSMCDLLFDVSNYDWPTNLQYLSHAVMMSALPLALAHLNKMWIPFINDLLDGDLRKNFFDFLIFDVLVYSYDLIICIDFTYISSSNTASGDVTN